MKSEPLTKEEEAELLATYTRCSQYVTGYSNLEAPRLLATLDRDRAAAVKEIAELRGLLDRCRQFAVISPDHSLLAEINAALSRAKGEPTK